MTTKQKLGCAIGVIALCITSPIWYYLLWYILKTINASDVAFLLFWVYVPVQFIIAVVSELIKSVFEDKK